MADEIHDLTAAYALDALDLDEERRYEEHLASCASCRDELARLREPVAALAYATPAPAPPAELRNRILAAARAERQNVVPLRSRRFPIALGSAAAVAASVALVLGLWGADVSDRLDRERSLVAILGDPSARTVALEGATGHVVVTDDGEAALVVADLPPAPDGKTYEIWVDEGGTMRPAGLFDGSGARDVVRLTRTVPSGAPIAVTIEADGGVDSPTGEPIITADS